MTSYRKRRYGDLSADQAKALDVLAAKIRNHAKATTKAIIEIGRKLIDVKQQLAHGAFAKWITVDCGFTMRTAQHYMRAATFAELKSEMVARLPPAALYRLSAKNAPQAAVADVLRRIETGQVPTECEVAALLTDARAANNPQTGTGRASGHRARREQPEPAVDERQRAAVLASEILSRLGPELARKFADGQWALVVECLREQLDAPLPADAVVASYASPGVNLVRDPKNANLFRADVPSIVPDLEVTVEETVSLKYCPIDHSADGAIPMTMCRTGLPHVRHKQTPPHHI
jgi:hypothetical protein